jgi:hypothetical protein
MALAVACWAALASAMVSSLIFFYSSLSFVLSATSFANSANSAFNLLISALFSPNSASSDSFSAVFVSTSP